MKHQSPEKVLKRFWDKAIVDYWTQLADAAPTPRHRNLYLARIVNETDVPIGATLHQNVKGVKMFCSQCLEEYPNVHPDKPAFCANKHDPVQVRPAKDIVAVDDTVKRWQMRKQMKQ